MKSVTIRFEFEEVEEEDDFEEGAVCVYLDYTGARLVDSDLTAEEHDNVGDVLSQSDRWMIRGTEGVLMILAGDTEYAKA